MKTKLFVMIGIVASGKSTIAKKVALENSAYIIESDEYRERLYGNASTQGNITVLFATIH